MKRKVPLAIVSTTRLTPSLNEFVSEHWRKRHGLRKLWAQEIGAASSPTERRTLRVRAAKKRKLKLAVLSYRRTFLDQDNFVGGLKPVLDALKLLGFIRDDSRRWLCLEAKQKRAEAEEGTTFVFYD